MHGNKGYTACRGKAVTNFIHVRIDSVAFTVNEKLARASIKLKIILNVINYFSGSQKHTIQFETRNNL